MARKTFAFQLYRTKREKHLHRRIDVAGEIYNHCVLLQRRYYRRFGGYINYYRLKKHVTRLKKRARFAHWNRVGSQAVQDIVRRVDLGYQKFFRKENKRPPKLRKRWKHKSFTLTQAGWSYAGGNVVYIGGIAYRFHHSRDIEGTIKTVTLKRMPTGRFFVFFSCEVPDADVNRVQTGRTAGFDFGLKCFLTGNNPGEEIDAPLPYRVALKDLRRASRSFSTKQRGSNHWHRARLHLARVHARVANQRRAWHWEPRKNMKLTAKGEPWHSFCRLNTLKALGWRPSTCGRTSAVVPLALQVGVRSAEIPTVQPPQAQPLAAATPRVLRFILWPAVLLVVSIIAWFVVTYPKAPSPAIPIPPPSSFDRRAAFYRTEITPLIQGNVQANREAAQRCLARIDDAFVHYRQGIQPFSEDITSMGARFGILVRLPSNWWYDNGRLEQYVQDKFETHLFSENQLNADLTNALIALRDDLRANRNQLLARTKVAIQESDFPDLVVPDYHAFDSKVNRQLVEFATGRAQDSVYHGIATFIVSEVAAIAGTQLLTRVVTSIGTGAVTSVAAGSSAAASGVAAGAGAGTMAGPLGTAIGIGVGIVVGVMVDWWMTEQFQAKLENDLHQYLTKLRNGIIEGVNGRPGMREILSIFNDDLNQAHRATMYHRLVGAYS